MIASSTSTAKKFWSMIPAAKAVDATTMPGPPRAFIATDRFQDENASSPATRAPTKTLAALMMHAAARKPTKNTTLKPWIRSSPRPMPAKYTGMKNASEKLRMASVALEASFSVAATTMPATNAPKNASRPSISATAVVRIRNVSWCAIGVARWMTLIRRPPIHRYADGPATRNTARKASVASTW